MIKQVSNIRLTSVYFFFQAEETLAHIIRAYTALYLGGPPVRRPVLAAYSSTTIYAAFQIILPCWEKTLHAS